jgi:hypothetical protein
MFDLEYRPWHRPFIQMSGCAAPMDIPNCDTDKIIPVRVRCVRWPSWLCGGAQLALCTNSSGLVRAVSWRCVWARLAPCTDPSDLCNGPVGATQTFCSPHDDALQFCLNLNTALNTVHFGLILHTLLSVHHTHLARRTLGWLRLACTCAVRPALLAFCPTRRRSARLCGALLRNTRCAGTLPQNNQANGPRRLGIL